MRHAIVLIALFTQLLMAQACGLFGGGTSDTADVTDTIDEDDTDAPAERVEHLTMLANLGFDTDPDPATDPEGEPLTEGYNPLKSKLTSLFRQCELYTAAMPMEDDHLSPGESILEDEPGDFDDLMEPVEDADWFTRAPMAAAAGDLDGDGFEEVVVALVDPARAADPVRGP